MSIYSVLAVAAGAVSSAYALEEQESTVSGSLFIAGSMLVVVSGIIGLGTQILIAVDVCRKRREREERIAPPKAFRNMRIQTGHNFRSERPVHHLSARVLRDFPPPSPLLVEQHFDMV